MDIPKSDIKQPVTDAVHYLKNGATACLFSKEHGAAPFMWPAGNVWSQRWQDVTCAECLKAKPADDGGGAQ